MAMSSLMRRLAPIAVCKLTGSKWLVSCEPYEGHMQSPCDSRSLREGPRAGWEDYRCCTNC